MEKYTGVTTIHLPRSNKARAAIYIHENKFYIRSSIYESYQPIIINNIKYSEVSSIGDQWFYK